MEMATLRVSRVTAPLRQQVLEGLHSAITEGRFRPGDRLIERELCELTGVSRTLIREALRQLETLGLVTIIPNKGPVVARISPEDAEDLYQVRAVLEGLASRLFAERASDEHRRILAASFERLVEALENEDPRGRLRAKTDFYEALLEGCGNQVVRTQLQQLHARIALLRVTSLSQPGRPQQTLVEIRRIVDAMERRDGQAAWDASVEHVERAAVVAVEALKAMTDESLEATGTENR